MKLGIENWRTFDRGTEKEYLITNGMGSFCSSTVIGANIRKYHGLLDAALVPPIKRTLLLSKLDETVIIGEKKHCLSSNEYIGRLEGGFWHLTSFVNEPLPKFTYEIGDVCIEKELAMEYGKNTVAIYYRIRTGKEPVSICFAPYVNCRDHHDVSEKGSFTYLQCYEKGMLQLIEKEAMLNMKIVSNCSYQEAKSWSEPFFYRNEAERGLNPIDCHFIPGIFSYDMKPYGVYDVTFTVTIEDGAQLDAISIIRSERCRKQKLLAIAGHSEPMLKELVLAADQFIVQRQSTGTKTIIAGYPWFTDWGRDTMIAFTGTTLATGRFEDAKEILMTFITYMKQGLIPNMFPDEGSEPIYNTADATLWFFYAVYKYLEYTKDMETIRTDIYPHLKEMIEHHTKGTMFDIYMDKDCLLWAGNPTTQLTWMDVKVGDWVVTPRHGKAVEINALWYNALKIMEQLSDAFEEESTWYRATAETVKENFVKEFWNENSQCLYDVIRGKEKIASIRPNQILAVSLPFDILDKGKSRRVVEKVHQELYTPYGLRSLSKNETEYIGVYIGDVLKRDGAYHQGTVWAWLMGPFVDAYVKANGYTSESREKAKEMLELFYLHMQDGCLGSIAEIFDGDEPYYPRGCMAQAWSVAEVLRAYVENVKHTAVEI